MQLIQMNYRHIFKGYLLNMLRSTSYKIKINAYVSVLQPLEDLSSIVYEFLAIQNCFTLYADIISLFCINIIDICNDCHVYNSLI